MTTALTPIKRSRQRPPQAEVWSSTRTTPPAIRRRTVVSWPPLSGRVCATACADSDDRKSPTKFVSHERASWRILAVRGCSLWKTESSVASRTTGTGDYAFFGALSARRRFDPGTTERRLWDRCWQTRRQAVRRSWAVSLTSMFSAAATSASRARLAELYPLAS
jgi:hypothetical protein